MRKKRGQPDVKKLIRLAVALAVIAAVAAGAYFAVPIAVSKYRTSFAESAIADGRPERAIELLLPELERDPKNDALRMKLVDLYISVGRYSRAEYLLSHGALEKAGQIELYRRLCEVFVRQDKLYDAVDLLNSMSNPNIREKLNAERPSEPVLDPPQGDFREALAVTLTFRDGDVCYVSTNGDVPTEDDLYTGPLVLSQGVTNIRAVTVSPDGLVSNWVTAAYRLDDIIEPVIFEDAHIEKIARELLDMPSGLIISDKLQAMTELIIDEPAGYKTLNDLRHFTHLETLSLRGGDTRADISALAGLTSLKSLSLTGFGIDSFDLSAIGQMEWLEYLNLSNNNIVSLDALESLTALKELNLDDNNILNLNPLSGMTSLEVLSLNRNAVESTSPLLGMTKLRTLQLSGNRVTALRGLSAMSVLTALDLSGNAIANSNDPEENSTGYDELSYLKGLSSIQELNLSANRSLTDLSALSPLKSLTSLTADNCALNGVKGLGELTSLKYLSLNENIIGSLEGLEECTALSVLWLDNNEITSLIPLSGLSLTELHIEHNKLVSLVKIKDSQTLLRVYAFDNPLTGEAAKFRDECTVYK